MNHALIPCAALVVLAVAAVAATPASAQGPATAQAPATPVKNIVLVHGAFADGSGWKGVYDILKKDGYNVSVVGDPLTSLEDDVAATNRVIARDTGPVILVGHSFGGAVISQAGDNPQVVGLVYIDAFVPDVGESALGLIPKDGPQPPLQITPDGFAFFSKDAYATVFANGIDPQLAQFMADEQIPLSVEAGSTPLTVAAWKTKPSWYLVGDDDKVIPPAAQLQMAMRAQATVVHAPGGHLAFISSAPVAAGLIEKAASSTKSPH